MERDVVTLPKPWSAHFSRSRNLIYYYNSDTRESIWSPPPGSVVGGVEIKNGGGNSNERRQSQENKLSPSNSDKKTAVPVDLLVTPPNVEENRLRNWNRNSGSVSCSTSITAEFSPESTHSGSSVDAGSETVTSSISRKRKLGEDAPHKSSKLKALGNQEDNGSSAASRSLTSNLQNNHDRTPAATRLQKLQNLLLEVQNKKKLATQATSKSASSSPSNAHSSSANAGRKRHSDSDVSHGKKSRLELGAADTSLIGRTHTDVHPGCLVTSTTVIGCTSRSTAGSVGSDETNSPLSPKPGEKLPYLDSDSDNTNSSAPSSKVVSSTLPVPSAAWASSHRKDHTRKKNFEKQTSTTYNSQVPVKVIAGDNKTTIAYKAEEKISPCENKTLPDIVCSVKSTSIAKKSVQSRLTKAASDTGSCHSSISDKIEDRLSVSPKKRFSDEATIVHNASNARTSVHIKPEIYGSDKGRNHSNSSGKSEESVSVPLEKRFSYDSSIVRNASIARKSVQSRLEISGPDIVSFTSSANSQASRTDAKQSKADDSTVKTTEHSAEPSDKISSSTTKVTQRVPSVPSGKILDTSKHGPNANVCEETESPRQTKSEHLDVLTKHDSLPSVWKPTLNPLSGYGSPATDFRIKDATVLPTEENMDVDVPVAQGVELGLNTSRSNFFNDMASAVSLNSEMPATSSKCTDDFKNWLHRCEPSSPIQSHDFVLTEEVSDCEESDEAMDWDDIEDLSLVVSVMPTKSVKADEWFIVVDTNILLHSLSIVEELRDTPFPSLGLPVLIIPWQVLQELDGLKDDRNQQKENGVALCSMARRAVQFLNSNLKKCHPRVRGQTARESEVEHYKRQGADDGILQCCLQLKEKGNVAVILTDDKNLANKAIVSGVSSFSHDEIMAKLHEMDVQLQSSKSLTQTRETVPTSAAVAQLLGNDQSELEIAKVDLVFCSFKLLLKDILSEALSSGMKKLYGPTWQQRTIKKPPWTLPEVLYCMLRHWSVVRDHEFRKKIWPSRDDNFMSCAKDMKKYLSVIQTFLKEVSQNCFSYSSSDLKDIINCAIDVCIGLTAESFREKLIETIDKLEILRDVCKEKSRETVISMLSDVQSLPCSSAANSIPIETDKIQLNYVREKFREIWELLTNVCGSVYDALEMPHSINYGMKYEFKNVNNISHKTSHIWPDLRALNKCFQTFEMMAVEELSEDHQLIISIYSLIKNINPDNQQDLDEKLSPQLVYAYLARPAMRPKILQLKEEFEKFEQYLMEGIMQINTKFPDFVVHPITTAPVQS